MSGGKLSYALEQWRHDLLQLLSKFWQWWTCQLLTLLPSSLQHALHGKKQTLTLALDEGRYQLLLQPQNEQLELDAEPTEAQLQALTRLQGKAAHFQLCLPDTDLLHTRITLPAATADKLHNVLTFEMDKHTPFQAQEVYFGYRIVEQHKRAQTILVELLLTTKTQLDPVLSELDALDLRPARVVSRTLPTTLAIPLTTPENTSSRRTRNIRQLRRLLILIIGVLLIALPLYRQQARITALKTELTEPKIEAEKAAQLKRQLKALQEDKQFLLNAKATRPAVLPMLDELTQLLPDHTWLDRLELQQDRVQIKGESARASELIGLLEGSALFFDVRFIAPITRNTSTNKERFVLQARFGSGEPL
ncbi:PilN domain-containing protein [Oceanisphaera sp. IT1-181]|uniref:PilN domain-containing protein n=1 Tax=Oceanisphaera sp. IT1-181 TaxID=3081199 RepID=UPI0029CAA009|nr:PilN domain-containing protein [Oceanisphaera sp. IT1-181]